MSADNWAICPQCMKHAEAAQVAAQASVEAVYGTIPSEEYAARREVAHTDIELDCTLREDYEVGMDLLGRFRVAYSASCDNCGFRFVHGSTRQADLA